MKNFMQKHVKKVVASATMLGVSALNAAPVDIPLGADTDITGSITNGGGLYILAAITAVGFIVIGRMIKKI